MINMKNLYLIRHAKAGWQEAQIADFDRPLTDVGIADAHAMGRELKMQGVVPDYVLSSPALRAITTARILTEELNFPVAKIVTDEKIYGGGAEYLVECIKQIDQKFNTVICVGHNPTLTWLFHLLCEGEKEGITTCGVVGIKFNMRNWEQLSSAEGTRTLFIHPEHVIT